MKHTDVYVTKEELKSIRIAQKVSGMWLSGGVPMGRDPRRMVADLMKKYDVPEDACLDANTGEFVVP